MALKLKGSTSGFVGLDAPEVAGNNTLILPESAGLARQVLANDITAGVTTFTSVTINRNGDLTVPGSISVGGTVTYEDVTSVDAVGIITARSGVRINGGGLTIIGNTTGLNATGISTVATLNFPDTNFKIGSTAGDAITTGNNNIAIGIDAMSANTVGDRNTAVGHYTLTNYNPSSNEDSLLSAFGYAALTANTTGAYNTGLGAYTLTANTTADHNTAIGYYAMAVNTTARENDTVGNIA